MNATDPIVIDRLGLTDDESISEFFLDQRFERRYTEQDIRRISTLLRAVDDGSWSNIPRLYIVLRRVGLLELRDHFISTRITDANFPFSDSSFPNIMEPLQRSAFLRMQHCVLTDATRAGKCELGEHAHFADPEQIPFRMETILGTGGFAQVEKVASKITSRQYARKLFHRRTFGRFQDTLVDFVNELNVLKRIRHQHIVEIIGSYTDPRYAALIISPVADCDLSDFLKTAITLRKNMSLLRTFFGCLATAVSHLHKARIRHKDIKPSNILVKDGTVLITDFGISRDCNNTRSTTEGPTARSPRYCAPEVADDFPRSFSSDIWSLGCVYLEMISVLKGYSLEDMTAFFESNGSQARAFWANPTAVSNWIARLSGSQTQEPDNMPLVWIEQMLHHDRSRRPSSFTLAAEITNHRSVSGRIGEFCGICCRIEDESFVDSSEALAPSLISIDSPVIPTTEALSGIGIASSSNSIPNKMQQSVPSYETNHGIQQARYFVLRSQSEIDIETSNAHSVWISGANVNKILNKAYQSRTGPIILFFSVVKSRKFCGAAEMTSSVDNNNTDEHWEKDRWKGRFTVDWLSWEEIDYDEVSHLEHKEGSGWSITQVRDGIEVCTTSGAEMMRRFGLAP